MQNIINLVFHHAKKQPQQQALLYLHDGETESNRITYGELAQKAAVLAARLQIQDLAGQRVLLLYPAGVDFMLSLLACWYAGVIPVPIQCPPVGDLAAQQTLLNSIANDADITAILCLDIYAGPLAQIITKDWAILATDDLTLTDLPACEPSIIHADTIAYLQYTSGSTSTAKAAIITHGNLEHSLKATIKAWHYSKSSKTLCWAPHSHVYGLVCGILVPLYHGTGTIIIPPSVVVNKPLLWLAAMTRYRVTHSGCPNFGYELCVRHIPQAALKHLNLKYWRVAINGGEVVQAQTLNDFVAKFRACGFKINQFCSAYGMSETAGAIACTRFASAPNAVHLPQTADNIAAVQRISSGRILPGLQVKIVDPSTGSALPDGEVGEIWLAGKTIMPGYWRRPEETAAVFHEQYFKTGDLGFVQKNQLYLTGRLKEVLIVHGKKYYPLDLEMVVAEALQPFAIDLPRVVFSCEREGQERVIVVQELAENIPASIVLDYQSAIMHALLKTFSIQAYEVVFTVKGAIPKTSSGKLQRKKCQNLYANQAIIRYSQQLSMQASSRSQDLVPQVATAAARHQIDPQFIALLADVLALDEQEIDLYAPLSRYNFDSINIIRLIAALNERYQLQLSPAMVYEYKNLAQFYTDWLSTSSASARTIKEELDTPQSVSAGALRQDIAIIGMSGAFPAAANTDEFWHNLLQGTNCISEIPKSRWDWQDLTLCWGGFMPQVDQFDAAFFNISPREAALMDPQQRLFLQTTWSAIEDAGYSAEHLASFKTGLFVGVFSHDYAELLQKNALMDAYLTTGTSQSMIANRISYLLNFTGPSETLDTACSSSLVAVHQAVQAIMHGDCEVAIAGGVNTLITPTLYQSAQHAGMLSEDGRCKTFAKEANGYVRGEGVGVIVLKKLAQAVQDGDHIYAVIKGTAINHGGHVSSLTVPNPNAQAEVIVSACRRAQIPINTLQYIETHGTGTPLGDPVEVNGLKKAFKQLAEEQQLDSLPQQYCGLGAVKTNIGHLESAAGIAGLIKILLALRHETLPANLHCSELNPYIDIANSPFYLLNKAQAWPAGAIPRRAGISSFGFGGANAHVILEESPQKTSAVPEAAVTTLPSYMISLSAKTAVALQRRREDLLNWLKQQQGPVCLAALSYTLNVGRQHFSRRFSALIADVVELQQVLELSLSDNEAHCFTVTATNNEPVKPQDFKQAHDFYRQGKTIDWQLIYGGFQDKISLPTYPFAPDSHWIESHYDWHRTQAHKSASQQEDAAMVYEQQFSGDEFYLVDHLVGQERVLPGVACLGLACKAAQQLSSRKVVSVKNIVWQKPINAQALTQPIQTRLVDKGQYLNFAMTNREQSTLYVSGDLWLSDALEPVHVPVLNTEALKNTVSARQTTDEIYQYFKRNGLTYGPSFQVIQHLWHDAHQVLADLAQPAAGHNTAELIFHPGLFDGILQTTQALLANRTSQYLPLAIAQLDFYQDIPQECIVYAQRDAAGTDDMPLFNIQVSDKQGALVLIITGFKLCATTARQATTLAYYQVKWSKQSLSAQLTLREKKAVVCGYDQPTVQAIQAHLNASAITSTLLQNNDFSSISQATLADYFIIALAPVDDDSFALTALDEQLQQTFFMVQALTQKLLSLKSSQPLQIIVLSTKPSVYTRALVGFAKSLHQEQSQLSCRIIEVQDIQVLAKELSQTEVHVRYNKYQQRFASYYQPLTPTPTAVSLLQQGGVYLITGGLGGLGYLFAAYLAEYYQAKLILTGRKPLSEHSKSLLNALEKKGATAIYVQADVAQLEDVTVVIEAAKQRFAAINGIIHAAGVTRDNFIAKKTQIEAAEVFAAKIAGTCNVQQATCAEPLDFFVLFSSVAAVFGNAGQSDYAYANCFLDEFAQERERRRLLGQCSGHTLAINWPLWQEGGLHIAAAYRQALEQQLGIVSLSTQQGLDAFLQMLHPAYANCVVLPGHQHQLQQALVQHAHIHVQAVSEEPNDLDDAVLRTKTTALLRSLMADTIRCPMERIAEETPFETYGVDSLMIIQLNQHLEKIFTGLPKTLFFEYQTLAQLVDYFMQQQKKQVLQVVQSSEHAVQQPSSTQTLQERIPLLHHTIPGPRLIEQSVQPAAKIVQETAAAYSLTREQNAAWPMDIAIIGLDGRYPQAEQLHEFWQNLAAGKDCISEIPIERWDWADYFKTQSADAGQITSKWGGFLTDADKFDPMFFNISPREAMLMDPQERLFLQTAWKTIEDAGYAREHLAGQKVGVFVGVMYGHYQLFANQSAESSSFVPTQSIFASIANRVSYYFDFHGPSIALDTMCSSSLTAIHLACHSLQRGESQLALAGGVNLSLHPKKYQLLSHGKFLSSDGHCRSFGAQGDGYVPGEGVGAVLLKPLATALADGDHIYGVIKGSSLNHGGKTNGYTVPNPNAQADLIAAAYQQAQISPQMISYLEAHGTGTALGDPIELAGLNKVFQHDKMQSCALGSVKSNIGHGESAAGIAALTKVLLQLQHRMLAPSILADDLNPNIDWSTSPFVVQRELGEWNSPYPLMAGINSFGAGGANAHLIIAQAPEQVQTPADHQGYYVLTLSAKTATALSLRVADLCLWLQQQPKANLAQVSYTLNARRSHFNYRTVLIVHSVAQAIELLQNFNAQGDAGWVNLEAVESVNVLPKAHSVRGLLFTGREQEKDKEALDRVLSVAAAYLKGDAIAWTSLYNDDTQQKISLPTYPFAKERYWWAEEQAQELMVPAVEEQAQAAPELVQKISHGILHDVRQILKITQHQLAVDKNLGEYGMDSVHFIELATRIASRYAIEFTPATFYTCSSITTISQYLSTHCAAAVRRVHSLPAVSAAYSPQLPPRVEIKKSFAAPAVNSTQDIAIIGMHGVFPQSADLHEFWQHLLAGDDLVTEVPQDRWDWQKHYGDSALHADKSNSKWGGFIAQMDQFDAEFFNISAREAHLMDPQHRLFLETVWKTIEDAGYNPLDLAEQQVGVFAGVEFSEYATLIARQQKEFHGYIATGNSHSLLANRVSYFFNFQGPSEAIDTACSSSLVAIHRAIQAIKQQECSVAIAGGVSLALSPDTFTVTSQLGALSADGRCKTFDATANGYVKGEGVATVLLKSLAQAQLDGDHIYAVIKASAVNHGGKAQSLTAPNAAAQQALLLKAYGQANIPADTISYIETHGTGTALGDPVEVEGLKLAFNRLLGPEPKANFIGLGSVKTNIGHLEPASGIAGLIKVILSMTHETIPGLLHFNALNPYIHLEQTPFYVANETQPWLRLKDAHGAEIPLRAGLSSFGFGGTNAHLVIEEGPVRHQASATAAEKPYYLLTLSAKQPNNLQQKIIDLSKWLETNQHKVSLPALSFTLNVGRAHFNYRCALLVSSIADACTKLAALINQQQPDNYFINNGQSYSMQGPAFKAVYQWAVSGLASTEAEQYHHSLAVIADLYTNAYPIDWQDILQGEQPRRIHSLPAYPFSRQRYWFDIEFTAEPPALPVNAQSRTDSQSASAAAVLAYLRSLFSQQLRIPAANIQQDETYEMYGVDSVIGLEITNRLEKDFGAIPKTLLYERNRLSDLAQYFIKHHADKLSRVVPECSVSSSASAPVTAASTYLSPAEPAAHNSGDIAIIGLSGTFPMADTMDEFWDNLVAGRDCVGEVPLERWNYKEYPVNVGGVEKFFSRGGFIPDVDKFDPLFFNISPRDAALMDPQERLFMQTVWATLEDGGYTRKHLQRVDHAVGVFAGVTYNFYPLFAAEEWQKEHRVPLDIQTFSLANRISYFLNLNGPSFVVDTACSSSLAAIHLACDSLVKGDCALAIAGGVNLSLHPSKYHFLGSMSLMSDAGRCASFAEGGSGYVPSEGVGAVLLKPLSDALRDNDSIYGIIKSSSMNHGGKTSGYTVPNPNAQSAVIVKALKQGQIDPRTISYVEAHGTGTALGDPIEVRGLQEAYETFTQEKQYCAIGSVKSNIGHLESAAGISQLAKVLLQLKHQQLVPTVHAAQLNPFIDFKNSPFYVQQQLSDWSSAPHTPRRAAISSFGAGGANVHMIVEEYVPQAMAARNTAPGPFLFVLSALNAERLAVKVQQMQQYIAKNRQKLHAEWLFDACYTLQTGREAMPARLAVLVATLEELIDTLAQHAVGRKNCWMQTNAAANNSAHTLAGEHIKAMDLAVLAQQWVDGATVEWQHLYTALQPRIISLPTYPFAKRRCWIPTVDAPAVLAQQAIPAPASLPQRVTDSSTTALESELATAASTPLPRQDELPSSVLSDAAEPTVVDCQEWLYATDWQKSPQATATSLPAADTQQWLIFSDKELGFVLQNELGSSSCIYCFVGERFEQVDDRVYYINPAEKNDYQQLFAAVHKEHQAHLQGVIYLCSAIEAEVPQSDPSLALLYLFKTLIGQQWQQPLTFCLTSFTAQAVAAQDTVNMWQHHLWSMTRIFAAEQPTYRALLLDLEPQVSLHQNAAIIVRELRQLSPQQNHIAYRANQRYSQRFTPYAAQSLEPNPAAWEAPTAALITGGLGALGYEVAEWLIRQGTRCILLTGTTELSAQTTEKNAWLKQLSATGAKVHYVAVDVTDKPAMTQVIAQVEASWQQPIDGVFHLAGVTTDNVPMAQMDDALWQKVMAVKVQGALILHELFAQKTLSCFVLFSSIAAVPHFGMAGLSAYAAANEFLSGLALYRRGLGLPAISMNWVAWAEKGMSHRHSHDAFLDAVGMASLRIKEGIIILQEVMRLNPREITICKIQWKKFLQVNPTAKQLEFFAEFVRQYAVTAQTATTSRLSQEQITQLVMDCFVQVLGLEANEVDWNTPLQQYGLDSIIGVNFTAELGMHFPDAVSPMDLYRYPTLMQLAEFITQQAGPEPEEESVPAFTDELNIQQMTHQQLNDMLEEELKILEMTYE